MSSHPHVPFVDLSLQNNQVAQAVADGFEHVISNNSFVLGPQVTEFEVAFASYCGAAHVVGVANGTDALEIALSTAGIEPGDEVIVPANTFVATAEAVARVGATVVLADCDETHLLDPVEVKRRLTGRTRAIVPVHLYGQMADVEGIREVVGDEVRIVEDAAQAQGARRHGVRAGAAGDIAATSFYPGKNLGAYGDAGAVITDSSPFAENARAIRNHGGVLKYEHDLVGRNSRMDSLQAVVLLAKLQRLDVWNEQRRAAARNYDDLLRDAHSVVTPLTLSGNEHVYHLYVVRVQERARVLDTLARAGIQTGIHYPQAVHLTTAFASLRYGPGDFPVSEAAAGEILSLPMFPGITAQQQERVVACLLETADAA